jgi:WD40 repeat protein
MERYPIEAGFPVNGLAEVTPYSDQEAGTSPDMLNLFPFNRTGRLRGGSRPGLTNFAPSQVNGSAAVQGFADISATFVSPALGDGTVVIKGTSSGTTEFAFKAPASGAQTAASTSQTYLAGAWGSGDKFYALTSNGADVFLRKFTAAGVQEFNTKIIDGIGTPSAEKVGGVTVDEDTVYVWYTDIDELTEGIMRLRTSDGSNRDSTTRGVWVRAEADATHIELVFGGIGTAGWTVLPAKSHGPMKTLSGVLAVIGAPQKDSGTVQEHQLVLYLIDTKTGIVAAAHDLSLDGTSTSADKGTVIDLEFGLDGFVYVLMQDAGTSNEHYLRKVDIAGNGIWEIQCGTEAINSICWNPDRSMLMACGNDVLGTGRSLVVIDPDSKGVVDKVTPGSEATWNLVRCDKDGNIFLFKDSDGKTAKFAGDFTQVWSGTNSAAGQQRAAINVAWNTGIDETGSTRYQVTLAIAGGTVKKIDRTSVTTVTNGAAALSPMARTIYAASFGVLTFFADGVSHKYYDARTNEMKDWAADVVYGKLPEDSNGGFTGLERWGNRLLAFGLEDDPSNFYFSARANPFDWKPVVGQSGAAVTARLGPTGLFPEVLVAAIPYNDDLLVLGGDHTLYQLSLDPAVDGVLNLISDTVGIAPGRAWCRDGYGSVYFFGNNGGIYRLSLNGPPQRISNRTIDQRTVDIDVANSIIHLEWDAKRQGIWVFVTSKLALHTTHYYYDFRTEGWFPVKFVTRHMNPNAIIVRDQDSAQDRRILMGGNDGYVREFSDELLSDNGTAFAKHFVIGPWTPQQMGGRSLAIDSMDVSLGRESQAYMELWVADDPESAVTRGQVAFQTEVFGGEINCSCPRIRGRAIGMKVSSAFGREMEFEGVRLSATELRAI